LNNVIIFKVKSTKQQPGVIAIAETRCYHQGKDQISIIQSWRQEGHPVNSMEINNTAIQLVVILTTGNRPTLHHQGKEGVVLYILHPVTLII